MAFQDNINSAFDLEALKKEQQEAVKIVQEFVNQMDSLSKKKVTLEVKIKGADTLKDLNSLISQYTDISNKLTGAKDRLSAATIKQAQAYKTLKEAEAAAADAALKTVKAEESKLKLADLVLKKQQQHEAQLKKNASAYEQLKQKERAAFQAAADAGVVYGAQSEQFKKLSASQQEVWQQLYEIEKALGRNQRVVGNYEIGTANLTRQIGFLASELPNAGISLRTFAMAVSNNIVNAIDSAKEAIKGWRAENAKLKADGEQTIPVWKRMGGAIFSAQMFMYLAVAAVTYLTTKLEENKEQADKITDSYDKMADSLDELVKSYREYLAVIDEKAGAGVDSIEREIELLKAQGASSKDVLTAEIKLRKEKIRQLEVERSRYAEILAAADKVDLNKTERVNEADNSLIGQVAGTFGIKTGKETSYNPDVESFINNFYGSASLEEQDKIRQNFTIFSSDLRKEANEAYDRIEHDRKGHLNELNVLQENYTREQRDKAEKLMSTEISTQERINKAVSEQSKIRLEAIKRNQSNIMNSELFTRDERLKAQSMYMSADLALNDLEQKKKLKDIQINLDKISQIERINADKRTSEQKKLVAQREAFEHEKNLIVKEGQDKENEIIEQGVRERFSIIQHYHNQEIQYKQDALRRVEENLQARELAELKGLENSNMHGQEYLSKRAEIEARYQKLRHDEMVTYLQDEITANEQKEKEIISSLEYSEEQKTTIRGIMGAERQALQDSINNLEYDKQKDHQDRLLQLEQEAMDRRYSMYSQLSDFTAGVFQAMLDGERRRLDEQREVIDKHKERNLESIGIQYDAEVDRINNMVATDKEKQEALAQAEQDKQDKITASNQAAAAAQDRIDKQKKANARQSFMLDRAKALAEIIIDTEKAANEIRLRAGVELAAGNPILAAKTLSMLPYVYGSGAIAGGLVAAQVLAYAEGTPPGGHPGGDAMLGDGGRSEVVRLKDGRTFITGNKPFLVKNFAQGADVYKSVDDAISKGVDITNAQHVDAGDYRIIAQLQAEGNEKITSKLDEVKGAIKDIPQAKTHFTQDGMYTMIRKGAQRSRNIDDDIRF